MPLDAAAHPEVRELADRMDDDVLDAIARLDHRGKGKELPPDPGTSGAEIEIDPLHLAGASPLGKGLLSLTYRSPRDRPL